MKKRLRKKKHLGEFRDWGREVEICLHSGEYLDNFLDQLVSWVEDHGCYCGGGGSGANLSVIIEFGNDLRKEVPIFETLKKWLESHPSVSDFKFGPVVDLWHGKPAPDELRR
jgi:uncharacterized protein YggL (DUF469 family)